MPNRLGLANWLVSDENRSRRASPSTATGADLRAGIVLTSEDFGTQGDRPTHPELLDWLATEFMQQGWSIKKILRTIVTSATYRQTSDVTPELIERDAYNLLLARGPRVRAEAEMIRDMTLAASGLLSDRSAARASCPSSRRRLGHSLQLRQVGVEQGRGRASPRTSIPSTGALRRIPPC